MYKINSMNKHSKNKPNETNTRKELSQPVKATDHTLNIRELFPEIPEEDRLTELRHYPVSYHVYRQMKPSWQKRYMDFMTGKASLPFTYDPFFKKLFNPEIHPERLSSFISSILGESVKVKHILADTEHMLPAIYVIILDIIVEMEDGSLANVEIQKYPYAFSGERMACYSSDLVLRQYSKLKEEKGSDFTYQALKKVYTIVLYEKSTADMKAASHTHSCIHHGKTVFDTGLKLNLLQEYFLISLDVFEEKDYPKPKNEQTAWLSLFTARTVDDLDQLIFDYPWMEPIIVEMSEYLYKPEEMIAMFSEALRILDYNTEKYMYEEMRKEIEKSKVELAQQKKTLAQQEETLAQQEETLAQQEETLAQQEETLAQQEETLAQQNKTLTQQQKELSAKDEELQNTKNTLNAEIDRLKKLLAEK